MSSQNLVNLFKQTLGNLSQLNERLSQPVLSSGDFDEQFDNLVGLSETLEEYEHILNQLSLHPDDAKVVDAFVLEVYRILNTLVWHVQEVSGTQMKVFKAWPFTS